MQRQFESFISNKLDDMISKKDLEKLFRVYDREHAETIYRLVSSALDYSPPYGASGPRGFISFWDGNIRKIIETLIPIGKSIRDDCCHPSNQNPSFGFLYHQFCVFRGEEKAPNDLDDPKTGLSGKMTWTHDPAPYIVGEFFRVHMFTSLINRVSFT